MQISKPATARSQRRYTAPSIRLPNAKPLGKTLGKAAWITLQLTPTLLACFWSFWAVNTLEQIRVQQSYNAQTLEEIQNKLYQKN
jgi:hypothetical protein